MYAGISQSDSQTAPHRRRITVVGSAFVSFTHSEGSTRVVTLRQRSPLRVLLPNFPREKTRLAVIANVSGGLVAGDQLDTTVKVGEGASVLVTTQAAEKVYRSTGAESRVTNRIQVDRDAWCEWLPQGTIIFDAARLKRRTNIIASHGARVLAGELLGFGRTASGESFERGQVFDDWRVRVDGRLVWASGLRLRDDMARALDCGAGFNGARAMATAVYIGPDCEELARELGPGMASSTEGLYAGLSCLGPLVVARWLGRDAMRLRVAFGSFWARARQMAAGLPARMPEIWTI
ncbi:MAG: urease accessory protein UreD [Deltaproteobacteria bacterium]